MGRRNSPPATRGDECGRSPDRRRDDGGGAEEARRQRQGRLDAHVRLPARRRRESRPPLACSGQYVSGPRWTLDVFGE